MIRRLCGLRSDSKGASLVELSLLMPIFLVLMGFIGEFSRAVYQFHVAEKGVKNAARYLARVSVPDVNSCGGALLDAYKTNAANIAQRGSFDTSVEHKLNNWTQAGDIIVSIDCVDNAPDGTTNLRPYLGADKIPVITVSTSFEFNDIGLLSFIKMIDPSKHSDDKIIITASHKEVYIGD